LYETLYSIDNKKGQESTAYAFVRLLAQSITNDHLSSAFRAVILLYVDKFGEERLIDAAVCAECIISAWRWKAVSVRSEGTLTHIRDNRLVPIFLDAVTPRQVMSQLIAATTTACQIPKRTEILNSNVKRNYFDSMKTFYSETNRNKILDENIKALISGYQQGEEYNE